MGLSNTFYEVSILSKELFGGLVEDEHYFLIEWFSKYMAIPVYERGSLVYSYEDVIQYFNDKYETLDTDSVLDILRYMKAHERDKKIDDYYLNISSELYKVRKYIIKKYNFDIDTSDHEQTEKYIKILERELKLNNLTNGN